MEYSVCTSKEHPDSAEARCRDDLIRLVRFGFGPSEILGLSGRDGRRGTLSGAVSSSSLAAGISCAEPRVRRGEGVFP